MELTVTWSDVLHRWQVFVDTPTKPSTMEPVYLIVSKLDEIETALVAAGYTVPYDDRKEKHERRKKKNESTESDEQN